jgi:hypothetical protein
MTLPKFHENTVDDPLIIGYEDVSAPKPVSTHGGEEKNPISAGN